MKFRWLITIGILFICTMGHAQRNNVWLLRTIPKVSQNTNVSYTLDFNYCPPEFKRIYIDDDTLLNKTHLKYYHIYYQYFHNSFCDTSGQFTFTELLGQHYYNKHGKIYDPYYISNNYSNSNHPIGLFLASKDKTYFFKAFDKLSIDTISKSSIQFKSDSLVICVSEFNNDGTLVSKNKPIFSIFSGLNNVNTYTTAVLKGKKIDDQTIEIVLSRTPYEGNHFIFNYDLKTGVVTKQKSLNIDTIYGLRYSTYENKIAVQSGMYRGLSLFENSNKTDYGLANLIDFKKYPSPTKGFVFQGVLDVCYSSNDSIVYAIVDYEENIAVTNKPRNEYLIAFNYYKPYTDYRFVTLLEEKNLIKGISFYYWLKLGPDGNVYGSSGGKVKGNFRIVHPNSIGSFKFELLPDIQDMTLQPNYSLWISTLEDYKKVQFEWKPTCKGLEMIFNNESDTQFFKSYRIFWGDNDSSNLNKNWVSIKYKYLVPGKYFVKLKAFSKTGGFIWYGDSIEINMPPKAGFEIEKTKGCQWIDFGFADTSKLNGIKPGFQPWKRWFLGDGNDSLDASANPKFSYIYSKSGTYIVTLIVSNGFCTDTAIEINKVTILPSPRPGISAVPIKGCSPLLVNFKPKYNDIVDSIIWKSNLTGETTNSSAGSFIYSKAGDFLLTQKLYGASGCITKDSLLIKVYPGLTGIPNVLAATVVDENTIFLKWKKHSNAIKYSIIRNQKFVTSTNDTFYRDTAVNTNVPNIYNVKSINICNDSTKVYDFAKTIYLNAIINEQNALLKWTPYEGWNLGINTYKIYFANQEGGFNFLAIVTGSTLEFIDKGFLGILESQKCYKMVAEELDGNFQISESNIFCLPLPPMLLIPNAFSPNGDGINEQWEIGCKGINKVNIRIFNRWGELIFNSETEKPVWDGRYQNKTVPSGSYFYYLEATAVKGEKIHKKGLIEVLR